MELGLLLLEIFGRGEQLPTAQAAALRLGISPMTVQRPQRMALASLREQVTALGHAGRWGWLGTP